MAYELPLDHSTTYELPLELFTAFSKLNRCYNRLSIKSENIDYLLPEMTPELVEFREDQEIDYLDAEAEYKKAMCVLMSGLLKLSECYPKPANYEDLDRPE